MRKSLGTSLRKRVYNTSTDNQGKGSSGSKEASVYISWARTDRRSINFLFFAVIFFVARKKVLRSKLDQGEHLQKADDQTRRRSSFPSLSFFFLDGGEKEDKGAKILRPQRKSVFCGSVANEMLSYRDVVIGTFISSFSKCPWNVQVTQSTR